MIFYSQLVPISTLFQPQGKLELKFERNALNKFWDNCGTDCEWRRRTLDAGRQTDDMLKPHTMSSADRVKQS